MRKFKKLASRVAAFSMATVLTFSGALNNFSMLFNNVPGSFAGAVDTYAADSTGTVNADVFSWDNASVYFLLTDRFYNGNTSNDHSYGRGLDQNGNVINIQDDRATFHGGDFAGITQKIEEGYFNDLGVNAIWISAPYEQIHGYIVGGDGKPSFAHYSYHGYYVLDYTQTDANFGTEEEFKELVDTAHENGIRVVIDIVLNHAGYNSLYDMNEYGFGAVKSGWDSYYYSMANVNNEDYHSYIDYKADEAAWLKWWGADWIRAGLPGYEEGTGSELTQSLAGLPDFKTESTKTVGIPPVLETKWKKEGRYDQEVAALKNYLNSNGYNMTVTNCISYWLSTWVREYGVDGFRCDTAKHVGLSEWRILHDMCTDALKEWKTNNPSKKLDDLEFWMTGECWDHKLSYDGYYTTAKFDSMINFDTTGGGVLSKGTVAGKYEDYANALNSKDDYNVLSYMSSHDSTLARGDMKYLGSALLMLPGGIQIFYGDETDRPLDPDIGFDGNGGAGHSLRTSMNWDDYDPDVLAHWQKVGTFRNSHIAVGAGQHTTVTASSGVGFVRTYSKGNVKDRIAAVIGASSNAEVSIDVSSAWNDGDTVVNYYDSSAAVVSGGKVTFNSGANGTILIGDPDGKPLVTIAGKAKFKGTQQVKVSLKDADYAIVSIDGGKNIKVVNGDVLTIGDSGFDGDTITINYKATNEKGTSKGKATFYKAYPEEELDVEEEEEEKVKGKIRVKMPDGSAPYVYAWQGSDNALLGTWPGTQLTQKDSEGFYYVDLDTTESFNMIAHNNGGVKTSDIKGLSGEVKVTVKSDSSYDLEGNAKEEDKVKNTITIKIKPYQGVTSAPNLYVWSDTDTSINGGFPGKQLTEKDSEGNWVFTVDGFSSVSCIVSNGSNQGQSDNITGITGTALITIKSADYKTYEVEKSVPVESKFQLMKKEARKIISWDKDVYTAESWNKFAALLSSAKVLIDQREENADNTAVTNMYNQLAEASKALVVKTPTILAAKPGSSVISGQSAQEATVTVVYGGKTYTATADELTGKWSLNISSSLSTGSTFTVKAVKGANSSVTATKQASNSGEDIIEDLTVSLSLSTTSVKVGSTVKFTAIAAGGNGNYKYTFKVGGTTVANSVTSNTYTWTADSAGTKTVSVTVSDGSTTATAQKMITVTSTPVNNLSVSLSLSATTVSTKTPVQITATATGGSGNYKYKYEIANTSLTSYVALATTNSNTHTWTSSSSAGKRYVIVTVTDGAGNTATAKQLVTITTDSVGGKLSLSINLSATTVSTKTPVQITATATGGSGNYKYKYEIANTSLTSYVALATTNSNTHTWTSSSSAGQRYVIVTVTDGVGNTATAKKLVTIKNTSVSTLKASINLSSSIVSAKEKITMTVTVTGGSGGYKYKYQVANSSLTSYVTLSESTKNTYTYTCSSAGTRILVITVTDSNGSSVTIKEPIIIL